MLNEGNTRDLLLLVLVFVRFPEQLHDVVTKARGRRLLPFLGT